MSQPWFGVDFVVGQIWFTVNFIVGQIYFCWFKLILLLVKFWLKLELLKKFRLEIRVGTFLGKKTFRSESFLGKQNCVGNLFFLGQKNLCWKYFWVKKFVLEIFLGSKKIVSEFFLDQNKVCRTFLWVKKICVEIFFW